MIAIVTDSTVGYSTQEVATRGIVTVVPVNYQIGRAFFEEYASDRNGAFLPLIEGATPCKTAQPTLGNFLRAFGALVQAGGEETPGPIRLRVDGQEADISAIEEQDMLLLPLVETATLLDWKASSESLEEETQIRRTVTLEKEESRITVAWTSSDNTASQITWQRDGLLIPVDPYITTVDDVVYVPAAFFEEAMDVSVQQAQDEVEIEQKAPADTPRMLEQNE